MAETTTEAGVAVVSAKNNHKSDLPSGFPELLISIRRHLHMYPELGFQEVQTSQYIQHHLAVHGLKDFHQIAETGLYIDIVGDHPGPTVGYRADIDALPIQDAKQVPYASRYPQVAHLCGHDMHTSVGIGVALLLHQRRKDLHGTVRVFFQPNEEGVPSGSILMIRDGVLNGLEAAYCIHADPTLQVGMYGLISGAVTAAADRIQITVRGRSTGHAARPHQTKDTIWITTQLLNHLYQITGRITDARHPAVITFCTIHGGDAHNVIPQEIVVEGTLRTLDPADRDYLKRAIRHTADEFSALHDVTIETDYSQGVPAVLNDRRLIQNIRQTVGDVFGNQAIYEIPVPSMGSEDFANYLDYLPGALIRVGTSSSPRTSFPLHDAQFDVDEAALAKTAQLMAQALINHLRQGTLSS